MIRTVEESARLGLPHGGRRLPRTQLFPEREPPWSQVLALFLLDYHPAFNYPALPVGSAKRGVGVHPHRGFETVTLALEGSVAHHDSAANSGVIGPGEVQWMTAASGVLHKEYHEESYAREGGPFHMLQLWVNLPAARKTGSHPAIRLCRAIG